MAVNPTMSQKNRVPRFLSPPSVRGMVPSMTPSTTSGDRYRESWVRTCVSFSTAVYSSAFLMAIAAWPAMLVSMARSSAENA